MTGATLGSWLLGAEIGRGPNGTVYRATDARDPDRRAAVKVLTADPTRRPEFLLRFPGEMLPLLQLRHPNVAQIFESGVHAGTAYYVSELIDGTDLGSLLKTAGRPATGLSWQEVVPLAAQLARGLKYGHLRTHLHRDLKPANVLVTADGTVKLTDLGVAKVLNQPPLVLPADPFGSAGFLAPEVFTGKPVTRRSDLYSLGCVLYAAVTGRPPYTAGTVAEFMHKHCYVLPDRPAQFAPSLPMDLDELICSLLNKDPNRRPASAAAVLDVLAHVRGKAERKGERIGWPAGDEGEPPPADHETPLETTVVTAERPRPLLSRPAVVIPLFLLVLGTAAALFFWPRPSAEELFARARPLIESDDPTAWEQAMDEYLTPLSERYPDLYADEIKATKTKLADHRRLRRAIDDGAKVRPQSEAERLYGRGLALAAAGDPAGARRVWEGVGKLFAESDPDRRWVRLAAFGVSEIDRRRSADDDFRTVGLSALIDRAKLLGQGDADVLYDLLERTYADDPPAREMIRKARGR